MTEAEALREAAGGNMGHTRPTHGGGIGGGSSTAGPVTLKHLVEARLLSPGPRVLRLEYKGHTYYADLDAGGHITYDRMLFGSPSAFSVYIKRLVTPTRKADDGWKSVRFGGKLLEHYKLRYAEGGAPGPGRRVTAGDGHGGRSAAHVPPPAPPLRSSGNGHDTRARMHAVSPPPPPPPPTAAAAAAAAAARAAGEPSPKRPRRTRTVSVRLTT